MEILAECYANACIARELLRIIREELGTPGKVRHSYKQGRDSIVSEIEKLAQRKRDQVVIAVIDYETGIARKYIEKRFTLHELGTDKQLLLGVSHQKGNVISIVFDPNIEEALLCRTQKKLCLDPDQRRQLKSSKACSKLRHFLRDSNTRSILHQLARKIIEVIHQNTA